MINHQPGIFQTIIPLKTRVKAERFSRYQYQRDKAKQVYLNTLAVSAVNSYLNSLGWSTNLEDSDSWNPILQTMMNVADLQVPNYGKLECRFVLAGDDAVTIPPEVWFERIGYVIVELEESLNRSTIIGFARKVNQTSLPLNQLESLTEFPGYLSQQQPVAPIQPITIDRWFKGGEDKDWQEIEKFFPSTLALNFRSPQKAADRIEDRLSSRINRVKPIPFLGYDDLAIALVLNIQPKSEEEFDISLMVCNSELKDLLPKGLEVIILDGDSCPVMIAQTKETKTIEFCFSGTLGESFTVELTLDEQIIIESFII
ncbi:DUF1822 family protein [Waterburya agarophytonicola K14]|uniref:DUF1822 family protein n=1 Tax=Waterburya agarophytonicola KI4 TaxID=2874699 RepID=A0A964FHC6_9CYAN|nr:DUF1822 family protein [Waterburya agarophytonicola]MCC0178947.1 DUF1822 family protein [Waterburya agarophytonicola KI4]